MSDRDSLITSTDCTGGFACPAALHVHGCFADRGNCTEAHEHVDIHGRQVEPTWPRVVRRG